MSTKLKFLVCHASSEDPSFPSEELNEHSPKTQGWQTIKFCEYPQEIGVELIRPSSLEEGGGGSSSYSGGAETVLKLDQIQLLSHQAKIASRIELYVGVNGHDYFSAEYERLGFMCLDGNERSNFQARELKTVYIDQRPCRYLKFIVHHPHSNAQNLFSQVGIVAINVMGTEEEVEDDSPAPATAASNSPLKKAQQAKQQQLQQKQKQQDSSVPFVAAPKLSAATQLASSGSMGGASAKGVPSKSLTYEMNVDAKSAAKLRVLGEAKESAILEEDFVRAKEIKEIETELKTLGSKLAKLDVTKAEAVRAEDFDRAKEIKDMAEALRLTMDRKIAALRIPAMQILLNEPKKKEAPKLVVAPPVAAALNGNPSTAALAKSSSNASGMGKSSSKASLGGGGAKEELEASMDSALISGSKVLSRSASSTMAGPISLDVSQDDAKNYSFEAAGEENSFGEFGSEAASPVAAPVEVRIHPLEGVPHYRDLPEPEEMIDQVREQAGIVDLFGSYRVQCLYSKIWALREAAILKIRRMLPRELMISPGLANCLSEVASVILTGIDDKMHQVVLCAVGLLSELLELSRSERLSRAVLTPILDPIITLLVERLADGNSRIREGARKGISALSKSSNIGPSVICSHMLRPLSLKQKSAWRPIVARLHLLRDLVNTYGIGGNSGISMESVMNFPKANGCFSHSNGEVRDASRDLTVSVKPLVAEGALDVYLKALRPKQLEEYKLAFERSEEDVDKKNVAPLSPRTRNSQTMMRGSNGGRVNTAASRAEAKRPHDEAPPQDFTICLFCGISDSSWNEDTLDLHYWKDCAMLAPCPACAQVVEVAGLPEHLLDECEHRESYACCQTTGLAIRSSDMAQWQSGPICKAPPHNCFLCPLCFSVLEDTDEAWKRHLSYACTQNTRTKL